MQQIVNTGFSQSTITVYSSERVDLVLTVLWRSCQIHPKSCFSFAVRCTQDRVFQKCVYFHQAEGVNCPTQMTFILPCWAFHAFVVIRGPIQCVQWHLRNGHHSSGMLQYNPLPCGNSRQNKHTELQLLWDQASTRLHPQSSSQSPSASLLHLDGPSVLSLQTSDWLYM